MQSTEAAYLSWPFPEPDGAQVRERLIAAAHYQTDLIAQYTLPTELGNVVQAALHQPGKLLNSPAIAGEMPLRRADASIWSLHVLLMHAATAHCDGDSPPSDWGHVVPIAAAAELLGVALDVFDDVQDQDGALLNTYGAPMMINGAMAMRELAQAALGDACIPAALRMSLHQAFTSDTLRAIGGQALDVAFERRERVSLDDAVEMTERKSGTLVGLMYRLGALAGLSGNHTDVSLAEIGERFAAFGRNLGVILQLENDWKDAWEQGQHPKSDRERDKKTLPLVVEATKMPPDLPPEERRLFVLRVVQTTIGLYRQRARKQLDGLIAAYHLSPRWLHWLVKD
jgi:geranylgeranyl pyrophosphate synthase